MSQSRISVQVYESTPPRASTTPPDVGDLLATAITRGVIFTWNLDTWINPYEWRYRLRVGTEAWSHTTDKSTWYSTLFPIVIRSLTEAELDTSGLNANIQIEVCSTDGSTYGTVDNTNINCLSLNAIAGDLDASSVTLTKLAAESLAKMFSSTDRDGADLKATSIALAKLASDATARMFNNETRTAADTTLVNGVAAATISAGAVNGTTVKATVDAKEANWDAAYSGIQTDGEINTLIDARRPDATYLNSNVTKTTLGLGNVENYSAANQIVNGLTAVNIATAALAWLGTAWQAFIDAAAQNDTIDKDSIETIKASHIQPDAVSTGLFDASGNLTFGALGGVGIAVGADVLTPALIHLAIHTDGTSKNLDLTKPKSGQTFDNLPDGATYKKCTVNQQTGAGRAYSALNSSNELITGTTNFTVEQIEENVDDFYPDSVVAQQSTGTVFAEQVTDVTGDGTAQCIFKTDICLRKGAVGIHIRYLYLSDGAGTLASALLDETGAAYGTPVTASNPIVSTVGVYVALEQTLSVATAKVAGALDGDWCQVRLYQTMAVGVDIKIKHIKVWTEKA